MIKKIENCLYCQQKMESKTAKKRFCSAKCRIYYNRELEMAEKRKDQLLKVPFVPVGKFIDLEKIDENKPYISADTKEDSNTEPEWKKKLTELRQSKNNKK